MSSSPLRKPPSYKIRSPDPEDWQDFINIQVPCVTFMPFSLLSVYVLTNTSHPILCTAISHRCCPMYSPSHSSTGQSPGFTCPWVKDSKLTICTRELRFPLVVAHTRLSKPWHYRHYTLIKVLILFDLPFFSQATHKFGIRKYIPPWTRLVHWKVHPILANKIGEESF